MEGLAVAVGKVKKADESGPSFDECADRRALVLADDQIPLPVAWFGSVLGWERTVMDGEHRLLEPGPASFDTLLGAAVVSARPQRGSSVWSQRCRTQQRRSRLVDGLVDALGTQPHAWLLGKASAQVAADLLRTPSLRQKLGHHQSERWNGFETSPVMAGSSCGRVAVGVERAVNTGRGRVAAQLPRDRRRRPPQPARDLSDAQARVAKVRELNPLLPR